MSESQEKLFLTILGEYCTVPEGGLTPELKFREDLEFSSLDFMAFLGDLEDAFDVELNIDEVQNISTVGEAMDYFHKLAGEQK